MTVTATTEDLPKAEGSLTGSVALVTGAGRGIGRVLARALAGAGAVVGLVARSGDQLAESVDLIEAAGGVAAAAAADVTDRDSLTAAIEELRRQLGPVDLLINNAGICGPVGDAWDVDPDALWRTIDVNLRSVFLCSRLVLPDMVARRSGRIVNVTSRAGVYRWPQVSAYSVSKAAVVKFTENLALETRRSGVSVFSVHPGITPIGLSEDALASNAAPGSPEAKMHSWIRQEIEDGRAGIAARRRACGRAVRAPSLRPRRPRRTAGRH